MAGPARRTIVPERIDQKGKEYLMSTPPKMPPLASPQLHAERLIVASNRGPVEYYLCHDELKHRRGTGGLVTALLEAGNRMKVTWVAMAMTQADRQTLKVAQHQRR